MGPLTLQIMILIASFMFYRILKSGFDSWKAILIDFGIVIFLFALQYYLQNKQQSESTSIQNKEIFPVSILSNFFGAKFPNKIALNNIQPLDSTKNEISIRPEYGCYLKLSSDIFMDPKQRKILHFTDKVDIQKMWRNNHFQIEQDGFYIIQLTCDKWEIESDQ
jgi:hypothetical protein